MSKIWWIVSVVSLLAACGGSSNDPISLGEVDSGSVGNDADAGSGDTGSRGLDADAGSDGVDGVTGDTSSFDVATDGDGDTGLPPVRRVIFTGKDPVDAEYEITAGVRIVGFDLEDNDTVDGRTASGVVQVVGKRDVYYVEGQIEELTAGGNVEVEVNGEIVENGPERLEGASDGDKPVIGMTIHSSLELLRRNGRVSERMVAKYAARAFDEAGYGYEITHNFFPERPPDEKANCSAGEAPQWWRERVRNAEIEQVAKDVNILMLQVGGGGCGAVGGAYGTTPARHIDQMRAWTPVGTDDWHRNMHGTLHEIGHQLGASHDHKDDVDGNQHPGNAWNETDDQGNEWFHRTPNVAGNGAPNLCGTSIAARTPGSKKKRHQTYAECSTQNFEVVSQ